METLFTKKQKAFIKRYENGGKFLMGEFSDIPRKFHLEGGRGLNLKAIREKIEEDELIKNFLNKDTS